MECFREIQSTFKCLWEAHTARCECIYDYRVAQMVVVNVVYTDVLPQLDSESVETLVRVLEFM